jgi:hypothetical protein
VPLGMVSRQASHLIRERRFQGLAYAVIATRRVCKPIKKGSSVRHPLLLCVIH